MQLCSWKEGWQRVQISRLRHVEMRKSFFATAGFFPDLIQLSIQIPLSITSHYHLDIYVSDLMMKTWTWLVLLLSKFGLLLVTVDFTRTIKSVQLFSYKGLHLPHHILPCKLCNVIPILLYRTVFHRYVLLLSGEADEYCEMNIGKEITRLLRAGLSSDFSSRMDAWFWARATDFRAYQMSSNSSQWEAVEDRNYCHGLKSDFLD